MSNFSILDALREKLSATKQTPAATPPAAYNILQNLQARLAATSVPMTNMQTREPTTNTGSVNIWRMLQAQLSETSKPAPVFANQIETQKSRPPSAVNPEYVRMTERVLLCRTLSKQSNAEIDNIEENRVETAIKNCSTTDASYLVDGKFDPAAFSEFVSKFGKTLCKS